jgi:hypothetical protein
MVFLVWCYAGVVVLFLVSYVLWPSNFTLCDAFILAFVTWGLDTLVHALGECAVVGWLAHLGCLEICPLESLVISSTS